MLEANVEESNISLLDIARCFIHLNDKEKSLDYLEKAYEQKIPILLFYVFCHLLIII